ncbi:hypothetical protein [Streptomyces aureus]|uniref:hypothetical protein n=1 Tax=Streptomyces aureus TaxID=193461 RepID=UPI000A7EA2B0|nr:hypothetical protein [Streptomyces aureus]
MNPSDHETRHHADAVDGHLAARKPSAWSSPRRIVWLLVSGSLLSFVNQLSSSDEMHDVLNLPVVLLTGGGILAMCLSPWWSRSQKWTAAAWLLVPNWLAALLASAIDSHAAHWALTLAAVGIRVGAIRWLWLFRTAPAPDHEWFRLPRWARILCWSAVILVVVFEAVLWGMSLEFLRSGGIKSGSLTP